MCGVVGFMDVSHHLNSDELAATVTRLTNTLTHRGPDDFGVWVDADVGLALGHRRLSIIDLSPCGHQPMDSADGRYVTVFNGEIYNFRDIRRQLEAQQSIAFRGHSDTEVALAAISRWGVAGALERFNGMFAIAIWDRRERVLYLARDRMGEKPMYYGWMDGVFLFGSELKALRAHPAFRSEIHLGSLALYLRHNYIPGPHSIYKGISKLQPGTFVALKLSDGKSEPTPTAYWSLRRVAECGVADPFTGTASDLVDALDSLLRDAVGLRMVADVPLGAFLSGGIDSSTVVAQMQSQSGQPVKTFTIGFRESRFDEAAHAEAVARHLGTDHTELYVTPQQAIDVLPRLPTIYDEPFADSSQIPTFLVSELARRHVTVALSGDGGDELFAGYRRYLSARNVYQKIHWIPQSLKNSIAYVLTALSPDAWDAALRMVTPKPSGNGARSHPGDRLHRLAGVLRTRAPESAYLSLVSHLPNPTSLVLGATEPPTVFSDRSQWVDLPDFLHRMMYLDTMTYLPEDILTKLDRASMSVSLEARVPLLDHRLIEFAWRVPASMKVRGQHSKWLLRQVLYRYVPQNLIERPKQGFGVPIGAWLCGPLREWADALLSEQRLRSQGLLDAKAIRERWLQHLTGKRDCTGVLWNALMFEAWLAEQ